MRKRNMFESFQCSNKSLHLTLSLVQIELCFLCLNQSLLLGGWSMPNSSGLKDTHTYQIRLRKGAIRILLTEEGRIGAEEQKKIYQSSQADQ